jgi:hypothetical protein
MWFSKRNFGKNFSRKTDAFIMVFSPLPNFGMSIDKEKPEKKIVWKVSSK